MLSPGSLPALRHRSLQPPAPPSFLHRSIKQDQTEGLRSVLFGRIEGLCSAMALGSAKHDQTKALRSVKQDRTEALRSVLFGRSVPKGRGALEIGEDGVGELGRRERARAEKRCWGRERRWEGGGRCWKKKRGAMPERRRARRKGAVPERRLEEMGLGDVAGKGRRWGRAFLGRKGEERR